MVKQFVQRSAFVLALTVLAVPMRQVQAQAPVVTGGNPVPTGEGSDSVSTGIFLSILLGVLSSV